MNPYRFPPNRMRPARLLTPALPLLLVALLAPALGATNLLTNGSTFYFERPEAPFRTIYHQENGFTVLIPPGAESLVVEWKGAQPNLEVEMMVRGGLDVGFDPLRPDRLTRGSRRTDFFEKPNPKGVARVEIRRTGVPALVPGIYYIGFFVRGDPGVPRFGGEMTATYTGGPIDNLFPVAESAFDSDAEGWTRNASASGLPGATVGSPLSGLTYADTKGNPGGHVRIFHRSNSTSEYFVAPEKFLVNLYGLADGRIEFDLARFVGAGANYFAEIRVIGDKTAWKWLGRPPPEIQGELNFFAQEFVPIWQTNFAPIRQDHWVKVAGTGTFEEAFTNPRRVEIRASYVVGSGTVGIDNVRVMERGDTPARPVLPAISGFSGGFDDWSRNDRPDGDLAGAPVGASDSRLLWSEFGGNPDGHIRIAEDLENRDPQPDVFIAPFAFLGDYTALEDPRFEFDFRMDAFLEATEPVKIRLYGAGSVYEWSGARPRNIWGHQVAPIRENAWQLVSGVASFEEVLGLVVRVEVTAQHSPDRERSALDNFELATADSPSAPQIMTVAPEELAFNGEQGGEAPDAQTLQVTASGGTLQWAAHPMGPMADKIGLSIEQGTAPSELEVKVDTSALGPGEFAFDIMFEPLGTTLPAKMVKGRVSVSPQPNATPQVMTGGVGNAASNEPRLSAGGLGVLYGVNLGGPAGGITTSYGGQLGDQLPTDVNGVRILFYETYDQLIAEGAILYLSDEQMNFQAPVEIRGRAAVRIVVANGNARSDYYTVQVTESSPGIFTWGAGRAVALNSNGSLNTAENAAARSKLLTLFATGHGATSPEWATGRAASAFPLIHVPAEIKVFIGGVEARIQFAGLTPGTVGVLQLNVEPAFGTPTGEQPVVVTIGGFSSQTATIAIR